MIVVIAHNIRSTHNVGSIFRTCDGFGVQHLYLSGYTPYPRTPTDNRLPHIADKLSRQIDKTALGADKSVPFSYHENAGELIKQLRADGFMVTALEQTADSHDISKYSPPDKLALLLGEEVEGIPHDVLDLCDEAIEIPMLGQKESFNVSVATGIALYALSK